MSTIDESLESRTRRVFHDIHLKHLEDDAARKRHSKAVLPSELKVSDDYFIGKICADLGCGSAVHGTVNLLDLGAKYVYAMDVDEKFKDCASKRLESDASYADRSQLDTGSILDLPYDDDSFDFILCHGVIHHTSDDQKAVNEVFRTLKKGGKAYMMVAGRGGIINKFFMELLRDEFKNNAEFRSIISRPNFEVWLKEQIKDLIEHLEDDGHEAYMQSAALLIALKNLIDTDLILSLRDRLEAPVYKAYTEEEWNLILAKAGFTKHYRISKSPKYNNLRRIFSPLYSSYQSPLARLFYGDGVLNVVVTK